LSHWGVGVHEARFYTADCMWNRRFQLAPLAWCTGWPAKRIRFSFIASMLVACFSMTLAAATPAKGVLSFVPSTVNFGSLQVGREAAISFFVTNTGSQTVTIYRELCEGGAFSATKLPLPYSLAPGKRIAITVIFAPKFAGHFNGAIEFVSDAVVGTMFYALTGSGVEPHSGFLSLTPNSASFGNVPIGTSDSEGIQLKNTSTSYVTITGVSVTNPRFLIKGLSTPLVLAPGHTASCTLQFAPSAKGFVAGSVSITSTAVDSLLTLTASGSGVAATQNLTVNPSALSFGSEVVGSSRTLPVRISNAGNSNIKIANITTSSGELQIGGGLVGATIAPGQTATLNVVFSPKQKENLTGSVTIQSNATNSPAIIQVSAAGIASPTPTGGHSVNLNWRASDSPNIAGYNIYRSSGSSAAFSRLTATPLAQLNYTDASVGSGQTYTYVVTAVDSTDQESGYSNPATLAIP